MEPSLNTWTIFFLVAAVQGLFLAVMIFLRKSKANNLLGSLILGFSICLLYYVGFWTNYNSLLSTAITLLGGLTYTFGPLLYFYIRSNRKDVHFNVLHFIPVVLFVLHAISFSFYPPFIAALFPTTQSVAQNLHLAIYTFLILQFTYKNKAFTNGALKLFQWRKKVAWAFFGYTLSFISYFTLVWTGTLQIEYDYMISVMAAFFIYFIGYHGFQQPEVFKMYENGRYEKSALNSSASEAILDKLRNFMREERPYLDSSLRLQDLAEKLSLSNHYISQVINDLDGKNFADFVNEYRVEEAKKLLVETQEKKIIHVAYDSGFNNKASFNNAFKRFTGMAPSEFRENQSVLA
ncbi:MAG: helix-turn-helix domain-containing protein [Cyclobacteriaceae bacterium]